MDDIAERELATCFAPAYKYDREELLEPDTTGHLRACTESRNDDAPDLCKRAKDYPIPTGFTQPAMGEPNVLFAMKRAGLGSSGAPRPRVTVTYRALWEWDGGFTVASGFFECGNEHHGDSQSLDGTIVLDTNGFDWWGELEVFDIPESERKPNAGGPTERIGGHPVVYLSAGKHHEYHAAGTGDYDLKGGTTCTDRHQGDGPVVIPGATPGTLLAHLSAIPIPATSSNPGFFSSAQGTWLNACFAGHGINGVPATGFQSNDLANMGYDQRLSDPDFFSGEAGSAGVNVGQASPDGDGDGLDDAFSFTFLPDFTGAPFYTTGAVKPTGSDRCPLQHGSPPDDDEDLLSGLCEPSESYRHKYVHTGSTALPACTASLAIQNYTTCRLGFLDSDQDATVNGDDTCPNTKSAGLGATDPNSWAELFNFPKGSSSEVRNNGQFHRGPACDPYPHGDPKWAANVDDAQYGVSGPTCTFGTFTKHIDGDGDYSTSVLWARSEIEPDNPPSIFMQSQTYRCRCDVDNPGCLGDSGSQCFAPDVRRAPGDQGVPDKEGWRPTWRDGCVKDANGYCAPLTTIETAKKGGAAYQARKERWNFTDDAANGPPNGFGASEIKFVPAAGNCSGPLLQGACKGSHTETKRPYALWTEELVAPASVGASWAASVPGPTFFAEPETTTPGQILVDTNAQASRRQRSGFVEGRTMTTPHTYSKFSPCVTINVAPLKYWGALWKVDPGPDDPYPWDKLPLPETIIAAGDDSWSNLVLIPGLDPGYLLPQVTAGASWVSASQGLAGAVRSVSRATTGLAGVLWVERGPRPRWAVLDPASRTDTHASMTARYDDVLDFPISASARLVSDAFGTRVAVLDPQSPEWMAHLNTATGTWRITRFAAAAVPADAAVYLEGSRLYAFGGSVRGAPTNTGLIYDLDAEVSVPWAPGFPARRDARLVRSNDSRALLLLGGHDGTRSHDDLWSTLKLPDARAKLVRPDTALAATFDARSAMVSAAADGSDARLLRASATDTLEALRRTARGWERVADAPTGQECSAGDTEGGLRCPIAGAAFWAPGTRECASRGGACVSSPSVAELRTELPGTAVDIAVDGDVVWTVSSNRARAFRVTSSAAPLRFVDQPVPVGAHEIAASGSRALVTSADGVRVLRAEGGAPSAPLPLCGRPLHVAALGSLRFAVATTLGFNVVNVSAGGPVLESVRLVFGEGTQAGQLEAMPVTAAKLAWCKAVDGVIPAGLVETLRKRELVAAQGAGRVVAGLSPWLFAIDAATPGAPTLRGVQVVPGQETAARWEGDRLYLASGSHQKVLRWVDGSDALAAAGTHQVPDWVRTRGEAPVVARLLASGKVEVAWVVE